MNEYLERSLQWMAAYGVSVSELSLYVVFHPVLLCSLRVQG